MTLSHLIMQLASIQSPSHTGMEEILKAEREWFSSKIQCGLEKTHRLLLELGMRDSADVLNNNGEGLAKRGSLDFVSQELDETSRKIFRSMFTEAEWTELVAVDAALLRGDVETLVRLREERLGFFLRSTRTLLLVGELRPAAGGELAQEMTDLVSMLNNAVTKSAAVVAAATVPAVESESLEQEPWQRRKRERKTKGASVVEAQESLIETRKLKKSRQALISRALDEGEDYQKELEASDEGDQEEEAEKAEEDEEAVTVEILLEHMRGDQDLVLNLLKLSGKNCPVKAFGIPNLAAVSSKLGEDLVADASKLASCLQHQQHLVDGAEQIEQLGRLLGWWRLVERCIHIMSILECLREKQKTTVRNGRGKRGQKVPLNHLYEQVVGKVESQGWKCMKLRQALCYDQLGKIPSAVSQVLVSAASGYASGLEVLVEERSWVGEQVG